jgi:hypothetical protein
LHKKRISDSPNQKAHMGPMRRTGLFGVPFFSRFSKSYTGATAVLVDEFDASLLEGPLHNIKCRTARLAPFLFELVNSHDTNACAISQALLTPAK